MTLCREGLFGYHINGSEGVIEGSSPAAAQPTCIPPGIVHYFWNARNDTDLKIDVTLAPPGTPAGSSINFFRTLIGEFFEILVFHSVIKHCAMRDTSRSPTARLNPKQDFSQYATAQAMQGFHHWKTG